MDDFEAAVRDIWCDVLARPDIADHHDFLQIGGDSLAAMAITSRIRQRFDVDISIGAVIDAPTFSEYVDRVREATADGAGPDGDEPGLQRLDRAGALPASLTQERLFHLGSDPDQSDPLSIHVAFRIKGGVDHERLSTALRVVSQRHEALRTGFYAEAGKVYQRIDPGAGIRLEHVRIDAEHGHAGEERVRQAIRERIGRPFDRTLPPLVRCTMFELSSDDHVLLLDFDHFICDGLSTRILVTDLASAYRELEHEPGYTLPALEFQFADWAAWQRELLTGRRLAHLESYWRDRLGPHPDVVSTALPGYAASTTNRACSLDVQLSRRDAELVRAAARERNVTLFTLMLSGFLIGVAEATGRRDLCVGTSLANREHVDVEEVFGPIAHDAYLRLELPENLKVDPVLAGVRTAMADLRRHGAIPALVLWERVWPDCGNDALDAPGLYFSLNRPWFSGFQLAGAAVELFPIDPLPPMPGLECSVLDGTDELTIGLSYLDGNYPDGYVRAFGDRMVDLLGRAGREALI